MANNPSPKRPKPVPEQDWEAFLWSLGIYAFCVAAFLGLVLFIG